MWIRNLNKLLVIKSRLLKNDNTHLIVEKCTKKLPKYEICNLNKNFQNISKQKDDKV